MRDQRGSAIIPALVFAMMVMVYIASVIGGGFALLRQGRAHGSTQVAQRAAESGVHYVAAKLSGAERRDLLAAGHVERVLRGSGTSAPRFEVTLQPGESDQADNDLDGFVDEEDEADIVEVVSTGFFDNTTRTVYVTLLARYRSPRVGAAAYVDNPGAFLDLDGSAFLISGHDVDMKGAETGELVPGIGVNGDPTALRNQITRQQETRVIGEGADPSVLEVPKLDLQELIEEGARSANVVLDSDQTQKPAKEGAWGTLEEPAVVYSSGSVKIGSGSSGAGILLVNGDLTITGGFEWKGLVIVRGEAILKGGGGGKRVFGALVVQSDLSSPDRSLEGIRTAGTVDVVFSRETVRSIARVLATYTILNWREGPTPRARVKP